MLAVRLTPSRRTRPGLRDKSGVDTIATRILFAALILNSIRICTRPAGWVSSSELGLPPYRVQLLSQSRFQCPAFSTRLTRRAREVAMPDWHTFYEATVDETNPAVFERLVFETEYAILRRLRELSKNPDGPLELNEISDAVANILRLKSERLGWPNPTNSQ